MISGAPEEARWLKPEPRRLFPKAALEPSAGGILPPDWRRRANLIALGALCEALTHPNLPEDIAAELVELIGQAVRICK